MFERLLLNACLDNIFYGTVESVTAGKQFLYYNCLKLIKQWNDVL